METEKMIPEAEAGARPPVASNTYEQTDRARPAAASGSPMRLPPRASRGAGNPGPNRMAVGDTVADAEQSVNVNASDLMLNSAAVLGVESQPDVEAHQ